MRISISRVSVDRLTENGLMAWLLVLLLAITSPLLAADRYTLEFGTGDKTTELRLSIGKSQIIYSPQPIDQVVIGSPAIADIKLLSARQVLILGKTPGDTNLVFRDKNRSLIAFIDVVVGYDMDAIKRKINESLPGENGIEVRGQNAAVMLSGEVSSLFAMDTALAIAKSFVPKNQVINMMQVAGGQQVMLQVKISEVSRSSLRELGIKNTFGGTDAKGRTYEIITGASLDVGSKFLSATGNQPGTLSDWLGLEIQALETKGLAKILAEPNIVALSGQEASFLAGGEFPFTTAVVDGVPTIDFKEFGVGLKFTPTVLSRSKINLKLNTEVSAPDETTALGGIQGITTRRAGTTVEVSDGQSFAIAGLIENTMNNSINTMPGLGDIPILGALFQSTKYKRKETELVIVITPRLVKSITADKVKLPSDNFVPPSWFDQYLMGRLEGPPPRKSKKVNNEEAGQAKEGEEAGVEGSFGHKL